LTRDDEILSGGPFSALGAYFDYDGNTANSSSGIVDTVISYDFFSSNGAPGSCGLLNNYFLYYTTNDTDAYYYYNGNTWQNFWNPNNTEPG